MPLHTDSAPPAHFRARVADHGRLTVRPRAQSPYAQSPYARSTHTSSITNTTTENG
ncbi:hypothetical protein [Streptomyces sp. NPDC056883]|uniref:hypothetical protein n=1 Tax=Streptomyces sp. NPDC056883 TaxID=3345959 RepID=UPI0036AF8885